jgi:hypothetical protein
MTIPDLSDSELQILNAAARRPDYRVLVESRGDDNQDLAVQQSLLARELIEPVPDSDASGLGSSGQYRLSTVGLIAARAAAAERGFSPVVPFGAVEEPAELDRASLESGIIAICREFDVRTLEIAFNQLQVLQKFR